MAPTLPYSQPATYQQWARDLEVYGGLPQTATEDKIISAWEQSENPVSQIGSYTSHGGYNALNTSLKTGSSGIEPGSSFIPTFPDIQSAIAATWSTLTQQNFAPELAALQQQSGSALVAALGSNGHVWGSSPSLVAEILGTGPSTASNGGQGGPTSATLTALPGGALDPLNWPGEIGGAVGSAGGSAVASALLAVIDAITKPLKTFVEDAGLVVLGIVMLIVAIVLVAHGVTASAGSPAPGTGAAAGVEGEEEEEESHGEEEREGRETEEREETRQARETVKVEKQSAKGRGAGGGGSSSGGGSNARALESEGTRAAKLGAEAVAE